jgi:2',3'-cyclic-nucleotide 2'-phosphodiesterase (5'-nucleotidase family)
VSRPKKGLTAQIALSLLKKAAEAEARNPEVAGKLSELKKEILAKLQAVRGELDKLDDRDRHLLTVPLINFIHDKADDVLVE